MNPAIIDITKEDKRAELARIAEANGGYLKPERVVEAARSPESPIHDDFEWDDTEAAAKYRLAQAGMLIRRIKIEVVRLDSPVRKITIQPVRAYQSRPSARHAAGGYESIVDIASDEHKLDEMLSQVLAELMAYRNRYAQIRALSGVWGALDEVQKSMSANHLNRSKPRPASASMQPAAL